MSLVQTRSRLDNKLALDENANLYEEQLKDKAKTIDDLNEKVKSLVEHIKKLDEEKEILD